MATARAAMPIGSLIVFSSATRWKTEKRNPRRAGQGFRQFSRRAHAPRQQHWQRSLTEAVPASRLLRDRRRGWPCVHQLLDGWIYPKIEALEGACSKQHEITLFAKDDIVRRSFARDVDKGKPCPAR